MPRSIKRWTWFAGVPFFAVLLIVFLVVNKRGPETDDRYLPLQDELSRRVSTPTPEIADGGLDLTT